MKFFSILFVCLFVVEAHAANWYYQQPMNPLPGACAPVAPMATPVMAPVPDSLPNVVPVRPFTTWNDSTGKYQMVARFISYQGGIVRLQKTDGKYCRIEYNLLSFANQTDVLAQSQLLAAK